MRLISGLKVVLYDKNNIFDQKNQLLQNKYINISSFEFLFFMYTAKNTFIIELHDTFKTVR